MTGGLRGHLERRRRVVLKVGSAVLASAPTTIASLADDIVGVTEGRRRVVVVSSGAIAFGMARLGMRRRPRSMPALHAAAAAGQGDLLQRWSEAFAHHGRPIGQVLLSHADLSNRGRTNNARATLTELLGRGAVPIINENDAVATDEIRFGDNDELAAMVTPLCDGDLLVLLSDVAGVVDAAGRRVTDATDVEALLPLVRPARSGGVGRGGMASKLEAARRASLAGADVVIAAASTPRVLSRVLGGEDLGTLVTARRRPLSGRKHWIAYTLRPRGAAWVDEGAARAITQQGRSVLSVGVFGIRGRFDAGDMIAVLDRHGGELARGLARMSSQEAARRCGQRDDSGFGPLIHRDDLVVTVSSPRDAEASCDGPG
ncbi:MAG: glutamate 5-kinase [Myxococcota bacterium]